MKADPCSAPDQESTWKTGLPVLCVVILLIAITMLHYTTPQTRVLLPQLNLYLSRHTVERIMFVLPITVATFALRWKGGLITLALAVLIMLPRAIWLSPYRADALAETAVCAVVGCLAIWIIEIRTREKVLRQRAVSRLSALCAITTILTRSLEQQQTLKAALRKILDVMGLEAGLIFTLDPGSRQLALAACEGIAEQQVIELHEMRSGNCPCEQALRSEEPVVLHGASQCVLAQRREDLQTQVAVPLISRGRARGFLTVAARGVREFSPEELALLTAIGNAIGVALENAQVYQSTRSYAREITRAQEEERQRIARELHDETIQMLVGLSRRLEALATLPEPLPEAARERVNALREIVSDALSGTRRIVRDLRPSTLEHLGLVAALEGLAKELTEMDKIETEIEVAGEMTRIAPEREMVLFRIAQEALNNVRRHSGASRATVRLEFQPETIHMCIEDNGHGFDAPDRIGELVSPGKLGLIGMDERARILGGTLTVRSKPGHGTTVTVDVPIQLRPATMGGGRVEQ